MFKPGSGVETAVDGAYGSAGVARSFVLYDERELLEALSTLGLRLVEEGPDGKMGGLLYFNDNKPCRTASFGHERLTASQPSSQRLIYLANREWRMYGTFRVNLRVDNLFTNADANVEALVDTGATHSMIPSSLLQELGIDPVETRISRIADGSRMELQTAWARFHAEGRNAVARVSFGPEGPI